MHSTLVCCIRRDLKCLLYKTRHDFGLILTADQLYFALLLLRYSTLGWPCKFVALATHDLLDETYFNIYGFLANNHKQFGIYVLIQQMRVPSASKLFPNAAWSERESAEMFGIRYTTAIDSRNLLLPYTMKQHPLKKNIVGGSYFTRDWCTDNELIY
uniref:NADH-ubiquinone oxidoreductase subunit 9 n=1 Tax=Nyctotherus ovalis TaxID=70075 RepID=F1AAJ1_NYCOV|nr:NADH-ubiquinone oxidoreductase subunit 9 [Nyctotherus ovalis]